MKALFVGLGSIGQRHLRNLKRLRGDDLQLSAFRTVGRPGMLNDLGEFHPDVDPAEFHGVTTFPSLEDALDRRPDVTFVTNPTAMHAAVAAAAVKAGSHVLIEKPLSHSLAGLAELQAAVADAGVVAAVAYQLRFHPALVTVKTWMDEGRVGRVVSAHLVNGEYMPAWHGYEDYRGTYAARRDLGGGALGTQSHEIDYALWLFGSPRSLFAAGGHLSDLEIDVEDVAALSLDFGSDGRSLPVTINLDYMQKPATKQLLVVGTAGTIRCDLMACSASLTPVPSGEPLTTTWPDFTRNDMYMDCLEAFLAATTGKGPAVVSLSEAITTMQTIDAAQASMRENRVVTL